MSCTEIFGFVIADTLCGLGQRRAQKPITNHVDMLSKINNALQVAADVIAPPCPRVEDLKYYWSQVVSICQRCQDITAGPVPAVEETNAPRHLMNMFKVLVAEESENTTVGGPLSPCMELIVQEKILVSLTSFAWADRPLGIRQHCYLFLIGILNHIHHTHLQHVQVHKPLQAMIRAISEIRASPYESQEIDFLATLCEKIRQDNSLILLYIKPETVAKRSSIEGDTSSDLKNPPLERSSSSTEYPESKFPLVDAFLNLCHSADTGIASTAHECLVIIAGLRDGCCSETMSKYTLFPHYLASRLTTALDNIPTDTEPMLLEETSLEEKLDDVALSSDSEGEDEVHKVSEEFPGRKELLNFLHWLAYYNQVVTVSDAVLGSSVCDTLREMFLESVIRPGIMSHDEDLVTFYTALVSKIVTSVDAPLLVSCVVCWLCEDSEDREGVISMRQYLIDQCRRPPHHLQIQTLRLIQLLIEKPGGHAIQSLVLNYVSSRGYYDSSTAEHQQSSWSDEEDERSKIRHEKDLSPGAMPISVTLAPPNINKIVKRFLTLVPEEVQSTSQDDYESYKKDAQRQYRDICRNCALYGWPREAISTECTSEASSTASKESKPEAEANHFYEGPLLNLLMDFLEQLPNQDYDINLQVTSLVSTLALLPHPHLHEYLLNPFLCLVDRVRTPFTILKAIVDSIHKPITEKEDYLTHLKLTRFQLLGTMEELQLERDDDNHKFEALIVIEEFSKELASIAYAKYTIEGGEC